MHHYMKGPGLTSCSVQTSSNGRSVLVGLHNYPLSVDLGLVSPADARALGTMLINAADECEARAIADAQFSDKFAAALAADEGAQA